MASDGSARAPRRVLIVCHANTSRSIIAEALLRRMLHERGRNDIVIRSGGIAPYARDSSLVSLDARLVLRDDGIELPDDATACDLKRHRHYLSDADLIVTMTAEQRRMLQVFDEVRGKEVVTLRELAGESGDIEDPAGKGAEVYRACRDQIRSCVEKIATRLAGGRPGTI